MSYSSPEGIILGRGSKLVSAELSIDKEKVLVLKQERLYTKEEVLKAQQAILGNIKDAIMNENYIVEYLGNYK